MQQAECFVTMLASDFSMQAMYNTVLWHDLPSVGDVVHSMSQIVLD